MHTLTLKDKTKVGGSVVHTREVEYQFEGEPEWTIVQYLEHMVKEDQE